jgi:DNA gyrase subunit B
MKFSSKPVKLQDCHHPLGAPDAGNLAAAPVGTELFVVEGDSAASAVAQLRNARLQAVLPMQGKPMNAIKATSRRVSENPLFKALIDAIGAGWGESFDLAKCRYSKIVLLMDPDADGIHCGALMLMFFHRWMRPLLEQGRVELVRPPVGEVTDSAAGTTEYAYTDAQFLALCARAKNQSPGQFHTVKYRGLAGIDSAKLEKHCVNLHTRKASVAGIADAELGIELFGPV